MEMTLTVANESNKDYTYHGEDRYFLSQGRTVESANKNMYKYLRKEYYYFEFEHLKTMFNLKNFLLNKFARWQNGKDTWEDEDSWYNQFTFTFPRSNRAGIIEISEEMYNKILEEFVVLR